MTYVDNTNSIQYFDQPHVPKLLVIIFVRISSLKQHPEAPYQKDIAFLTLVSSSIPYHDNISVVKKSLDHHVQ